MLPQWCYQNQNLSDVKYLVSCLMLTQKSHPLYGYWTYVKHHGHTSHTLAIWLAVEHTSNVMVNMNRCAMAKVNDALFFFWHLLFFSIAQSSWIKIEYLIDLIDLELLSQGIMKHQSIANRAFTSEMLWSLKLLISQMLLVTSISHYNKTSNEIKLWNFWCVKLWSQSLIHEVRITNWSMCRNHNMSQSLMIGTLGAIVPYLKNWHALPGCTHDIIYTSQWCKIIQILKSHFHDIWTISCLPCHFAFFGNWPAVISNSALT